MEDLELQPEVTGKFFETLTRSPKEIIKKRAAQIALDTKDEYEMVVKELQRKQRSLMSERMNNEDLSPSSKDSMDFKNEFTAKDWVRRDLEISMELEQVELKLRAALKRVKELF